MDDICNMMDNTNIWDAEQNWDLFLKDAEDYRLHVFCGQMYPDIAEKKQRASAYVKLKDLPVHLKNVIESALNSWDILFFSSMMLHLSDRLIYFIEVSRCWRLHRYDIG